MTFAMLLPVTSPARARPSLASFWNDLAPLAVLPGPPRHVSGRVDLQVSELAGTPLSTSSPDILRDEAMVLSPA